MGKRLRLIAAMLGVVLAGFAFGSALDWLRLPGVELDALPSSLADGGGVPFGPADAATTVTVFTDYRCAVCRLDDPQIAEVAASASGVRFVYKEWAILGRASRAAARVALAAAYQGRYAAVRTQLMRGRIDGPGIREAARAAGVDWPRLQRDLRLHAADIDTELARTSRQAFSLGLPGTPAYLVGRRLVVGRLSGSKLRRLIALSDE